MKAFDSNTRDYSESFNGYFWLCIAIACLASVGLVYASMAVAQQHEQLVADQEQFEQAIERHMTYRSFMCESDSFSGDALLRKLNNQTEPLTPSYIPDNLVEIPYGYRNLQLGTMYVRTEVLEPLRAMIDEAQKEGVVIRVNSAYRSYSDQAQVYETFGNSGVVIEGEHDRAARPGYSEHQLGTAVDFSGYPVATQTAYDWLRNNAYRYGFALSYPDGAEEVTEYRYEPWHWRYVGVPLSTHIQTNNIVFNHEQALLLPSPLVDRQELAYEYTGRDIWVWKYRDGASDMEVLMSGWQTPAYQSDIVELLERFREGRISLSSTTINMPMREWVLTDDSSLWRDAGGTSWWRTVLASPENGEIERLEVLYREDMGYVVINYQTEEAGERLVADLARTCRPL